MRWEYRWIQLDQWFEKKLDQMGRDGWEAVGVFHPQGSTLDYLLFKRPLQATRPYDP